MKLTKRDESDGQQKYSLSTELKPRKMRGEAGHIYLKQAIKPDADCCKEEKDQDNSQSVCFLFAPF